MERAPVIPFAAALLLILTLVGPPQVRAEEPSLHAPTASGTGTSEAVLARMFAAAPEPARRAEFLARVLRIDDAVARIGTACRREIDAYCALESAAPLACLERRARPGPCCASALRAVQPDPRLDEPLAHHALTLPAGSTLEFDDDCGASTAVVPESVRADSLWLGPGRIELDAAGRVLAAQLSPGQRIGGVWFAGGEERIELYPNGLPVAGVLHRESLVDGLRIDNGPSPGPSGPSGSAVPGERAWHSPEAGPTPTRFHRNGRLAAGWLAAPVRIEGFPIGVGAIELDPDGHPIRATAGVGFSLPGIEIPLGSTVTFGDDGSPDRVWLSAPSTAAGLAVSPDFGEGYGIHSSGHLARLRTARFGVSNGEIYPPEAELKLDAWGRATVESHRAGMARYAGVHGLDDLERIGEPVTIGALTLPARSWVSRSEGTGRSVALVPESVRQDGIAFAPGAIRFDGSGTVVRGVLAAPHRAGDLTLARGEPVERDAEGTVRAGTVGERFDDGSRVIDASTRITFHPNGRPYETTLAPGSAPNGVALPIETGATFAEDDTLRTLDLAWPLRVGGLEFDGRHLYFASEGHLEDAILNRDTTIGGVRYAAGTQLRLDRHGKVVHSLFYGRRWPDGRPPERGVHDEFAILAGGESIRAPLPAAMDAEACERASLSVYDPFARTVCDPDANTGVIAERSR